MSDISPGAHNMVSSPVERMYRDAKILQIYEGTNEIQKLVTRVP